MKYIFLAPWKIPKNSLLLSFSEEFLGRISKSMACEFIVPSSPLDEKDLMPFFLREFKKIGVEKPLCFALDENGKSLNSAQFAQELKQQEIQAEKVVVFLFGSAYGLPKELAEHVRLRLISLSPLTMAHELAFCVTLEQVYRARCILANHPYHHGEKSPLAKLLSK